MFRVATLFLFKELNHLTQFIGDINRGKLG